MQDVAVGAGGETWLNSLLLYFNVFVQLESGKNRSWVWTSDSFVHILKHFPIKIKTSLLSQCLNFNSPGNQQVGTVI